jgi:predicted Zn finger-like uncharacterized protein
MEIFTCPACQTAYRVTRKSEPSDREPHCQECGRALPDDEGESWLHYQRSPVVARVKYD